jgi:hypothetical protein
MTSAHSGEIKGLSTTELTFTYSPMTFATAEAEMQIRTTEFDSQPFTIRVVGSSSPS